MAYPPRDLKRYREIRSAFVAGRAQRSTPRPVSFKKKLMQMKDITSSYPNSSHEKPFPIYQEIPTTEEVLGKQGIYRCTIHSQPALTVLPRKEEGKPLNWRYNCKVSKDGQRWEIRDKQPELTRWATSRDIAEIRNLGHRVEVHEGYYWEESTNNQFDHFIGVLFKRKTMLDQLAKEGKGNPAAREVTKLLLNSLTGKLGERIHFETAKLCGNDVESCQFLSTLDIDTVETDTTWSGAKYITGKLREGQEELQYLLMVEKDRVAPTSTLAFIYSGARYDLYEMLCRAGEEWICDTDSCFTTLEYANKIRDELPHKVTPKGQPKRLGDHTDELRQDGNTYYDVHFGGSKFYDCHYSYPDDFIGPHEKPPKIKSKGIGGKDLYITDEDYRMLEDKTRSERARWFDDHSELGFSIAHIAYEVFERVVAGETIHHICNQFKRHCNGDVSIESRLTTKAVNPDISLPEPESEDDPI